MIDGMSLRSARLSLLVSSSTNSARSARTLFSARPLPSPSFTMTNTPAPAAFSRASSSQCCESVPCSTRPQSPSLLLPFAVYLRSVVLALPRRVFHPIEHGERHQLLHARWANGLSPFFHLQERWPFRLAEDSHDGSELGAVCIETATLDSRGI